MAGAPTVILKGPLNVTVLMTAGRSVNLRSSRSFCAEVVIVDLHVFRLIIVSFTKKL